MFTRFALAVLLVAASPSLAPAQSSTATSGTTKPLPAPPMKTAPASGQAGSSDSNRVPPAARSGEKGLRIGNDAVNGDLLEIKRVK